MKMKTACQPHVRVIHGTTNDARMAPMLGPELNHPVAYARSFFGNHSAIALIAAGKLADSPSPRENLATAKPKTDVASACPIAAMLHTKMETR